MGKTITVSDFIDTKYRDFWGYSNKNGKNSVDPREQLPEVVRKIIFGAYRLKIREREERKTTELMGEVGKFHAHGPSSIEDSIKGVATAYKSQPAARLLEGIGNFGSAPGDEGAAGRYTNVSGTPLLSAIYRDIPFVPMNRDDTGLEQPEYISLPLPMSLITGMSPIGTGKSCYIAERNARDVIEWIDDLRKHGWILVEDHIPNAMSVTGCKTWYNYENGYVYYDAVVHYGVDENDFTQKGKWDIITELPPKSTPANVIYKLTNKLPSRIIDRILDFSGKGKPTCILVPKGYLKEADFTKYGMRSARKEQIFIWDNGQNTMKNADLIDIAKGWFEDRCLVVTKRLNKQIKDLESANHRIDLIKEFAVNKMINWKSEDVIAHFINLNKDTGEEDAGLVLSQPARTFLPENIGKNEIILEKNNKEISNIKKKIKNIGDEVINEAYSIIDAQERFFEGN